MVFRRETSKLKQDRPPFRALNSEELELIAKAAGVSLRHSNRKQEFETAIDSARYDYCTSVLQQGIGLTDRQIEDGLIAIVNRAKLLLSAFADRNLQVETSQLSLRDMGAWRRHAKAADEIQNWAGMCLERLASRKLLCPSVRPPSASRPGLPKLSAALVGAWRVLTGNETTLAPSRPLVSFVSKAHEVITQGRVEPDTVKRWLRRLGNEDEERTRS